MASGMTISTRVPNSTKDNRIIASTKISAPNEYCVGRCAASETGLRGWSAPAPILSVASEWDVEFRENVQLRVPFWRRPIRAMARQASGQGRMVLDILVRSRRDTQAAKRLLRTLPKKQARAPRVVITGKLASHGAAERAVMPSVEHRKHKGLNNRAENSHQPTRRRERQMKRFKSAGQAQRFLSAHDRINNLFVLRRHQISAVPYRAARIQALQVWAEATGVAASA